MTAAAAPPRACWRVLLLAALTVVLGLLLPAAPASAPALPAPETRVGVSAPAVAVVVGVHECITAGQCPVRGPSQLQVVVVTVLPQKQEPHYWRVGAQLDSVDDVMANGGTLLRGQSPAHVEAMLKNTPG